MNAPLLRMAGVSVRLPKVALRPVVADLDLHVNAGEVVGLVGESGSGKSVTARAILGLLPPNSEVDGTIEVAGLDVLHARAAELARLRTSTAAMVFQDPRAGINPLRRIGDFLTESTRLARGGDRHTATARAVELLQAVGLPDPQRHLRQYPHELSGGMLQRVMIASALMGEPDLLLCDEPTTALDVTTQAEILAILGRLQREKGMGMLFITHDLDLAAAVCSRVYVMYAGRVVEHAAAEALFADPRHPYTSGLLNSTPSLGHHQERLVPVKGAPLSLLANPPGCAFADRCDFVDETACTTIQPSLDQVGDHQVRCARVEDIAALSGAALPGRSSR